MRYDLTSLKVFVAVAECANLTRAADREHLAVSAISKRIAELESLAGTALLVRYPRGVGLTPAGQALLHHARQMLGQVRRMEDELAEFVGSVKGRIRVQAIASALTQFLPEELESFLSQYPDVDVTIEERVGTMVVRAVAEGAADLGIVSSQTPLQGLASVPYHQDRLMLGVPVGHPLAKRKSVRLADALAHPFIGAHTDSSLTQLVVKAAKACGRTVAQRIHVSSFEAMCRLAQTRLGITLLPEGVLAPHVAAGRLRAVRLDEDWAVRQLVIVMRDPQELAYVARTFVEHLQQSAASSTARGAARRG